MNPRARLESRDQETIVELGTTGQSCFHFPITICSSELRVTSGTQLAPWTGPQPCEEGRVDPRLFQRAGSGSTIQGQPTDAQAFPRGSTAVNDCLRNSFPVSVLSPRDGWFPTFPITPVASHHGPYLISNFIRRLLGFYASLVLLIAPSLGFYEAPKPSKHLNSMNIPFQFILFPCQLRQFESTLLSSTPSPWLHVLQESFPGKEIVAWTSISQAL